jgi:hypothetical protein
VIPSSDAFLRAYRTFARAHRLGFACDEGRVAEALREAATLAQGRPEDEPAALLFAFSTRARALPDGWRFVALCADNLARVGLRASLVVDDPFELDVIRLRVAAKQISFDEMRAWVAARLRPSG